MTRDAQGIDLVVGAKGSPLQLILSAVYHIDIPTGNIAVAAIDQLRANRLIAQVIPSRWATASEDFASSVPSRR